jgi:electron transfer flavoprotein alpha subunit
MVEDYPIISEKCNLCGLCVNACPENAISFERAERCVDLSDYKGVLVYAEQRNGKIHNVVYELLGKGRELADQLEESLFAVVIGSQLDEDVEKVTIRGPDKVYVYDHPELANPRDDPYSQLLVNIVHEVKPSIFLIGATAFGRSIGPKVAASLKTGLTADCTGLEIDTETKQLLQTRPAYGGNVLATIVTKNSRPQMATVRYKVMKEAEITPKKRGEVIKKPFEMSELLDRVKIVDFKPVREQVNIVDAEIIVSGGKGLGNPQGFKIIEELARIMGGAVGASRPTVDEDWIEYHHQVGLSGRTVRPKLYMACGISGAVQHLAGMKTSDSIISINKDPDAPILNISSLGAVGDLYEVIPILIKKIKEHKKNG